MSHNSIFSIVINGNRYNLGFSSIEVNRSIDDFCGTFKFKTINNLPKNTKFPITRMANCSIFLDDVQIMNGYVEVIEDEADDGSHEITISGRDITCDIVDSKIILKDIKPPYTVKTVVDEILAILNLTGLIKLVGDSPSEASQLHSSDDAESCFDILAEIAAKKSYLLTTNGDGNIQLLRATDETQYKTILSFIPGQGNIKKRSIKYDDSKRFNSYRLINQGSVLTDAVFGIKRTNLQDKKDNITAINYTITDPLVRNSRILTFKPDDSSGAADAKKRCTWEMTYRKSEAFVYTCTVKGLYAQNDDDMWKINRLVRVIDQSEGLDTVLLIKAVKFTQSVDEGGQTELTLVDKLAFYADIDKILEKEKKDKAGNLTIDSSVFGIKPKKDDDK